MCLRPSPLCCGGMGALTPLPPVPQSGIVQLLWEESSAVVYTCSLDGAVRLWDARSGKMISEYRGHSAEILDFAINK